MKKRTFLTLICLSFTLVCFSQEKQKYNFKRAILPASLSFVSGGAWAFNQVLQHKNAKFMQRFPNANPKFWGADSWKNKYNNFDPEQGRNDKLVWLSDGKHLTATINQTFAFGAGLTIGLGEKRKWWHYVADAGISFASYSLGNFIVYDVIFK